MVYHKINRLHERGLRALVNDQTSTFNDKLSKSYNTTIHVRNIQKLMTGFCKYFCGVSTPIMKEFFTKKTLTYKVRSCSVTLLPNPKTEKYDTDRVPYKAAQVWSTLPTICRNLPSLYLFKFKIKNWHCSDWPCNICQIFVDGVGFVNWI